jgi:hypothetical protein
MPPLFLGMTDRPAAQTGNEYCEQEFRPILQNDVMLSAAEFSHAFDPNSMVYRSRGDSASSQTRINESRRTNHFSDCKNVPRPIHCSASHA